MSKAPQLPKDVSQYMATWVPQEGKKNKGKDKDL